jgi:hypothetical protein
MKTNDTELELNELKLLQRLVHEEVLKARKENNVYRENIAFNTKIKLHNLFVKRKIKIGIN